MPQGGRATRINLLDFKTPQMRAFHMSWFAFFLCFFAWFGIAPLMDVVRTEMTLTKDQVGWCIIGSVAITIVTRMLAGRLCDRYGPRRTYSWLLILGSLPVMAIGLAHDFQTFLLFRVLIGGIGASFVITQYHTSVMFAPNCVGTANATSAGWGNLGGGVTQIVMPLVFSLFAVTLGLGDFLGWRLAMVAAGFVCMLTGVAYYFLTQDTPRGDLVDLRAAGLLPPAHTLGGTFGLAARDPRVWALFVVYGACFGVELTMDNIAALYYKDYFGLSLKTAGLAAGSLGMLHIFARSLGGYMSDRIGSRWGLKGRVNCLFAVLLAEGLLLMFFSRMTVITLAIPTMLLFGLFMKMSEGATYAVVPFINKKALGSVAGIIGAGGNAGAVAAGFLFKAESISWPTALLILGMVVSAMSFLALTVRFSHAVENEASSAHVGFHPQRQPGFSYLGVALPVGRMSCKQMEGLADIADRLGDGLIRLTVWQNLLIPGIAEVDVDEVKRAIEQLGFEWDASSFRSGLIACTGNAGCKFSASDTKRRAMILARHLEERLTLDRPINIHVTGCRNSCAQHYIGDIGLEGTKVEVGEELVEGYHLCVGGGWGLEQGIGRRLIESLPLDEIPPIVERLLLHYLDGREGPAESFAAFVRRHTIEELRCVVRYEPAGR